MYESGKYYLVWFLQWWAESPLPSCCRIKLSENLGVTAVAPVATVDASLNYTMYFTFNNLQRSILNFHFMNLMLKTIFQGELFEMCK